MNTRPISHVFASQMLRCGLLALLVTTAACGGAGKPTPVPDSGQPVTTDAGVDAGVDAGIDGGFDAGTAGGLDAGTDAGTCDASSCDDGNPCTTDTCTASGCTHSPSSGQTCDDHNACTKVDVCQEGVCVGQDPVTCDPPKTCEEQGVCDPASGECSHPFSMPGTTCDDGNVATYSDACDGTGACVGLMVTCPANTGCLTYAPNGTATCVETVLDAVPCDDGDACTQTDTCQQGLCVGTNPIMCAAPSVCELQGSCDPGTGQCSHPLSQPGTACDDGSLATYNDSCNAQGQCSGTAVVCPASTPCVTYAPNGTGTCTATYHDGATCDDGSACTQTDTCQQGTCVGQNPVTCPAPKTCQARGVCDPGTGVCSPPTVLTGTACDDGNVATYNDTCDASGTCAGTTVTCPPNNACVTYAPNGTSTCMPTYLDGAACDDNNACTPAGVCSQGTCVEPPPVVCDNAHQCQNGACVCPTGWTGPSCTTDVDECANNPNICGGGSTCTNTPGSYTCACIKDYSSPTGANCVSSVAALELVFFYDDSVVQMFGSGTEAHLADVFAKAKDVYDASFPGLPLTLSLNGMVRLSPLPSPFILHACNTPNPSQPSCIGCWINTVPADCSAPDSTSASEIDEGLLLQELITYAHTLRANNIQTFSGGMDVPVLLTTADFASSAIGLATIGAACNSYSGAVIQVLSSNAEETALTIAHELGHNLSMQHDSLGAPYIMAPSLNLANTTFSSASVTSYTNWRSQLGSMSCISNPAHDDWRSHLCGNGQIDPGETCDPGVEPDSCCDSTCHLKPGCVCGNTEPCCLNGQPRPAGTVCRASAGVCDSQDTCDGNSGACLDIYASPRTTCTISGTTGYCLDKKCASRDLQCSSINDSQFPNSTACASSTSCSNLVCSINSTCDATWLTTPQDGSSCGAGKQCRAGVCVDSTQLANYAWVPGAWSACANGVSTRTLTCVDETGATVSTSACDPGLAPAASKTCP